MSYKRKKFIGAPIKRGGYFPVKDYMEHYRVLPQPEDEYHKKLRHEIEKSENSLSPFKDAEPHYRTNFAPDNFSRQNMDDFQDALFKRVMDELSERKDMSSEVYQSAKDVTDAIEQNQEMGVIEFTEKMLGMDDDILQINKDLDRLDNEISKELLETQGFLRDISEVVPDAMHHRKLNDSEVNI
ncbi:hypothetical protein [Nitrosarchaeum sp. AC2]|uniref:hypothetical protein n=1 Tax=Nitrosarchaeum sp. AC2 TaxID=2259673 RepID=UPI0015C7B829|nr:hypothetical protein [Nitrosarchaeum sp. AC2]